MKLHLLNDTLMLLWTRTDFYTATNLPHAKQLINLHQLSINMTNMLSQKDR